MRRILLVVTVATIGVLSWSVPAMAGGGGHESACAGYATGQTVEMYDSCFSGSAQFVGAGTTVRIVNRGELPHSLTAADGSFGTGTLQPGQSASIDVGEAAVVRVFCELHGTRQGDGMAGLLVVGRPTPAIAGSDLVSAELESAGLGGDAETSGSEPLAADPSATVVAVPAGDGGPSELVIAAVVAAVAALGLAGVSLGFVIGRNRAPEPAKISGEPVIGAG
jgi:plastocyanin